MVTNSKALPRFISICSTEFTVSDSESDFRFWLNSNENLLFNSFVIHDPDRSVLKRYAKALKQNGYVTKVLDLTNVKRSCKYNPFAYLRGEDCVAKLAAALASVTKGLGAEGDTGFISSEIMLLTALIGYIYDYGPTTEHNFKILSYVLEHMLIEEGMEGLKSAVDFIFEDRELIAPEHFSLRYYMDFREKEEALQQQIVASCMARIAPLSTADMIDFISEDGLSLNRLGYSKTALFVIDGDGDAEFNFLVPLMYSQLFDLLQNDNDE